MGSKTFQIGALPRSGTAWLAGLINLSPTAFCSHDKVSVTEVSYKVSGSSGSHLLMPCFSDLEADVTIAIIRDTRDVIKRLEELGFKISDDDELEMIDDMFRFVEKSNYLIKYSDLFCLRSAKSILETLTIKDIPEEKIRNFVTMNVQKNDIKDIHESVAEKLNSGGE